ncbi:phosphatase PAP2 family protein [Pseudonocardia ailaonensis]|uniref:phosphatase PAP2 family protein n=1 Tax=Pseudonocardia ailaonensis TaxID=367279 RepID=UPI0031D4EFAE
MAVLTVVTAVVLPMRRHARQAVVVVVAGAGAGLLVAGLKGLYARQRPHVATQLVLETNASLPSGHALSSLVVVGIVAAVLVHHLPGLRAVVIAVAAPADGRRAGAHRPVRDR